jgi:hypothetical protein
MHSLLANIDVNGDGEIDLWELCRFLVARHDQILGELDDGWALEQAFNILRVDDDGCVSVGELRRIMCMRDDHGLEGVGADGFHELLTELGVAAGSHGSLPAGSAGNGQAGDGTGGAIEDSGTGVGGDGTDGTGQPPSPELTSRAKGVDFMDQARVPLAALKRHPAFAPKAPAMVNRSHL